MPGWIYNTNYLSKINGFSITNGNNSTCAAATADINYINSNFADLADTEPDVFYVNAPGLSCQLVFDKVSGQFQPVEYQDIKVTSTANGSTGTSTAGLITGFTITTDKGIKY